MKAVKAVGILGALAALMVLGGCGNGSIKSPDFEPVTTLISVDIQPATAGQPNTLPAGTTLSYRAMATVSVTVQPGTKDAAGNEIDSQTRTEDVTSKTDWTSSNMSVATVSQGVVTGQSASATPVTITASYGGKSDTVQVTVTSAVLTSVVYAAEAGTARTSNDQYTVITGNNVPFQLYGRFSDQTASDAPRLLDDASFGITWTSSATDVANNPAGDGNFTTSTAGTTVIRGTVTQQPDGSAVTGVTPTFATATLVVQAANAFCDRAFVAPSAKTSVETSIGCLGCTVANPEQAIDGDLNTDATMDIPLGLLLSATLSLNVSDSSNPLTVGKSVGLVLSRDADLLSAELLSTLTVTTVNCDVNGSNCTPVETFAGSSDALHLGLLGLIGSVPEYLLATDPITQPANGVRLSFQGGLVSLLASLHVHSACAATAASATP
ncbi:hypothetical protein [Solimonas terrae]|uniref:BIG2 domain-containing protein n=1 Tax=Solimonas terrae TaxID=1396819 RepID=A0A6M2BPC6_9GAMM|nr:hypothetical protein [Solimonas terrae]NGY04180.1 hypothetical protein [Solimonas terrae]